MPVSKYDKYFGGNANKAYQGMIQQYGEKRGKSVFYATIAKRKKVQGG